MDESALTRRKEKLSIAYLRAVVAHAGGAFTESESDADDFGIDGQINFLGQISSNPDASTDISIAVQVKATSQGNVTKDKKHPLQIDPQKYQKYHSMSRSTARSLFLLCLFCLPSDEDYDTWLEYSDDQLLLHGRMFWQVLNGAPEPDGHSKTIHFPDNNRLTTSGMRELFRKIAENEDISYAD